MEVIKQRKIFLYYGINQSTKLGIVALFKVDENISKNPEEEGEEEEVKWKEKDECQCQALKSLALFWIAKPGSSSKRIQCGITKKQCKYLFNQLLDTIHNLALELERNG